MIDAPTLRRQFVVLTALRWLSSGLMLPVLVLLFRARALSVTEVGTIYAVFMASAALLEVPTGGLADSWGRRPTLLCASCLTLVGCVGLAVSTGLLTLTVSVGVLAAGRALASGPLDAWFVDHRRRIDPEADLTPDLAAGARAQGLALAAGVVVGSLLPYASRPLPTTGDAVVLRFSIPVVVAACVALVELVCVRAYIDEPDAPGERARRSTRSMRAAARIAATDVAVRRIVLRYGLLGAAMAAFELLIPLRLAALSTSPSTAAAIYGVAMVAALILGALVAPSGVALTRKFRRPLVAAGACTLSAGLVAMGASIPATAMAVVAMIGLEVLISPAGPILRNVLHDHTGSETRATLLSVVSLISMAGGFGGSLVFTFLVERTSLSLGLFLGGLTGVVAALPLLIRSSGRTGAALPGEENGLLSDVGLDGNRAVEAGIREDERLQQGALGLIGEHCRAGGQPHSDAVVERVVRHRRQLGDRRGVEIGVGQPIRTLTVGA